MTKTRTMRKTTARRPPVGSVVYVLDAWNDADEQSVVAVFATRLKAEHALEKLLNRPGDWYAGVVRRTIQR